MKAILGTKIGMSQFYREDGSVLPVTLIAAGPVTVTQVRTEEKDGYRALQIGFGSVKRLTKPRKGHLGDFPAFRWLREVPRASDDAAERGTVVDVGVFQAGERVTVSGLSKGKGFAGGVKRHHFRGGWASHGAKHSLRQPGSIGSSWPERVRKGKRMAGRMGHERVTVKRLEVVHVDVKKNLLALRGAVPGARGTLLEIRGI